MTRRLAAVLTLVIVQLLAGCTFLENLRRQPTSPDTAPEITQAIESVERRTAELADLEKSVRVKAPEDLGRARAILDEMVYFRDKSDPEEVMRLDDVMAEALNSARRTIDSAGVEAPDRVAQLEEQNRALQTKISSLESQVAGFDRELKAKKEVFEIQNGSLVRQLEVAEKSRDEAIREVVRTRSRIEGMASEAEASAMFAEARVLVDRMVEDAFNKRALGELEQARTYLISGKKELDDGNSGGAAYLFDLISSLYEGFKTSDPRRVTIGVRTSVLYSTPSASSKKVGFLSQGQTVMGIETISGWIKIRTASGQEGWIRKNQVQ
jgi:hypothetical protein